MLALLLRILIIITIRSSTIDSDLNYLVKSYDSFGWNDKPDVDEAGGQAVVDDGGLLPVDHVDDVLL